VEAQSQSPRIHIDAKADADRTLRAQLSGTVALPGQGPLALGMSGTWQGAMIAPSPVRSVMETDSPKALRNKAPKVAIFN
jgi:hypothetical protein